MTIHAPDSNSGRGPKTPSHPNRASIAAPFADPFHGRATISTVEMMRILGVSRTLAQSMIRDGRVTSVKLGKSRRIVVDSVRALIAGRCA